MAKMTDTEKLNLLIRDDPEISGKMYARMKMHINEATVVDAVEVVHGRWEKKTADCVYYYACSECGEPVPSGQWGNDFFSNYCPNCGAKMEGDGNG